MDKLESLSNTISNLTLYDIKSMYNQAKNVVLNVSETEAKVREATNDEPWGASSTLMQEIAQGTFNFQQFNEIMPCIYARFMEKEARQWRQIYKALQLLEYLIKHGSERVVDDARSHISTLKMLRNFHYIDDKGKDEGLNVRNRAKELVELLSDVERIRTERRKAKANKTKYVGVGNDGFGSRYGGFGNDSYGGYGSSSYTNDHYANSSSRYSESAPRRTYDEYNAGDDELPATPASASVNRSGSLRSPTRRTATSSTTTAPAPAPAPAPVPNLLDFDDDIPTTTPAAPAPAASAALVGLATNKALPTVSKPVALDDDDFDDFQAAPVQPVATATPPVPAAAPAKPNLMQMLSSTSTPRSAQATVSMSTIPNPAFPMGMGMGMGTGMGVGAAHSKSPSLGGARMSPQQQLFQTASTTRSPMMGGAAPMQPMMATSARSNTLSPAPLATATQNQSQAKSGGMNFDDLWNMSLGSSSGNNAGKNVGGGQGKSIKDLEKEKASQGLWSSGSGMNAGGQQKPTMGGGFGNFGSSMGAASGSGAGGDDNLLL